MTLAKALARRARGAYWEILLVARYLRRRGFRASRCESLGRSQASGERHGYLESLTAHFINLDSRRDRLKDVTEELQALGLKAYERWPATASSFGARGCSLSHFKLLSTLDHSKTALVCEDDIEFLAEADEIEIIVREFLHNPALDVLCLGNNVMRKPIPISKHLCISRTIQTTSCYLVKPKALPLLAKSAGESAALLAKFPERRDFRLDIHWQGLQRSSLIFAIPRQRLARQRESYSNIEGTRVDYGV